MNATGSQQTGVKPTIVLVHGAFADGSSWNGVIERPQQQAVTDHILDAARAVVDAPR